MRTTRGDQDELWVGSTVFRVLTDDTGTVPDKKATRKNNKEGITICMQAWGLSVIPQSNMFAPQSIQYLSSETPVGRKPVLHLILQRQSGRSHTYQFELHLQEIKTMVTKNRTHDHCVILHEMERNAPCLVLMCAEEQNWFTFLQTATEKQYMNVVTITEDDDATSSYGKNKVKACLRSDLDCAFFARPCTGGSAWNRLNRTISNKAAAQVKQHQRLYWKLWEHFADALERVFPSMLAP